MRRILLFVLIVMFAGVGSVYAYPIDSGDSVYLLQSDTGAVNGDFKVVNDEEVAFHTFCVEKGVTFHPGSDNLYTATIDEGIKKSKDGEEESLHDGAKYLYWNFTNNSLSDFSADKSDIELLQNAFWMLQGDIDKDESNEFYSLAIKKESMSAGAGYDVMVMNLWSGDSNKQSQLIAGSAPVPEPSTMLLLGSGLVGLALYRRRKQ